MLPVWLASLIFFSLLGLLVGSQVFWFWRARRLVHRRREAWQRWLLGVPLYAWFLFLAGLVVLIPFRWLLAENVPVLLSFFMVLRRPELMIPVGLWITASMFSFLLIVVVRGVAWLGRGLRRVAPAGAAPNPVAPERRYFLQTATYLAGALPFVLVGYGFLRRQDYQVQEVSVPLPNLPQALDGLRLLQLTDVHASAYMPLEEVRRIVGQARELAADLVFHTGDFITSRGDPLAETIAELSRVQGRYGSFGCLGNHEIYAEAEGAAARLFSQGGVSILRGKNAEVEIGGARLNIIGVDYQRQPRGVEPDEWPRYFLHGAERLIRPGLPNILLSHNPNPFLRAAELGIDLTLAGHTHGGQVQVEILDSRWSPARFITPFISGLYERPMGSSSTSQRSPVTSRAFLYVSRGLGTIAAPIRLNAPPEITLLTLRRGSVAGGVPAVR